MKHDSISSKYNKAHRAQNDVSEALEQFHGSLKKVCPERIHDLEHKAKQAKTHIIQDAPSKTHIM